MDGGGRAHVTTARLGGGLSGRMHLAEQAHAPEEVF